MAAAAAAAWEGAGFGWGAVPSFISLNLWDSAVIVVPAPLIALTAELFVVIFGAAPLVVKQASGGDSGDGGGAGWVGVVGDEKMSSMSE